MATIEQKYISKYLIQLGEKIYSVSSRKIKEIVATPQMTSNIAPIGRAFANDEYDSKSGAWCAFDKTDSLYYVSGSQNGIGYLGYEFIKPISIGKYTVRSYPNSAYGLTPKNWTFEGSKDGINWIVLDTQTNQIWKSVNTDKEYLINLSKINNYKMYRLNWTAISDSSGYTHIGELKMYEIELEVINLPNLSEQIFINYGIDNNYSINLTDSSILKRNYVVQDSVLLNSGKEFKQIIDTSRILIKKVSIT